jgi:hypothetical protein
MMSVDGARGGRLSASRRAARTWLVRARARLFPGYVRRRTFSNIYDRGGWVGVPTTASGSGSTMEQTAVVRRDLPAFLAELGARSLLDAPCGDFHWMQSCDVDLDRYIGVDIVRPLIDDNRRRYGGPTRTFDVADLAADPLPQVDVVLCRDCLVHLTLHDALAVLRNFKRSGSTYLLTTTFPATSVNDDLVQAGGWRPLNLEEPPFGLPRPIRLLNEGTTEWGDRFADKSLGLWRLVDLELG